MTTLVRLTHASGMYDRNWLEGCFRAKRRLKFLFFWGHQPSKDGAIVASCLSQWWPARFEVAGIGYPSAEHWMMAEKARLFGDVEMADKIAKSGSPKQAKELGRQVRGFDADLWDANKRRIVEQGSYEKFRHNTALRDFLLSTGDKVLVEASPVDRIWGIGLASDDERAANPVQWRGENLLGFALMTVRDQLAV